MRVASYLVGLVSSGTCADSSASGYVFVVAARPNRNQHASVYLFVGPGDAHPAARWPSMCHPSAIAVHRHRHRRRRRCRRRRVDWVIVVFQ